MKKRVEKKLLNLLKIASLILGVIAIVLLIIAIIKNVI